jgi:hypothetical protein
MSWHGSPDRADVRSLRQSDVFPGPVGGLFYALIPTRQYHMVAVLRMNKQEVLRDCHKS